MLSVVVILTSIIVGFVYEFSKDGSYAFRKLRIGDKLLNEAIRVSAAYLIIVATSSYLFDVNEGFMILPSFMVGFPSGMKLYRLK